MTEEERKKWNGMTPEEQEKFWTHFVKHDDRDDADWCRENGEDWDDEDWSKENASKKAYLKGKEKDMWTEKDDEQAELDFAEDEDDIKEAQALYRPGHDYKNPMYKPKKGDAKGEKTDSIGGFTARRSRRRLEYIKFRINIDARCINIEKWPTFRTLIITQRHDINIDPPNQINQ